MKCYASQMDPEEAEKNKARRVQIVLILLIAFMVTLPLLLYFIVHH